jgi:hypothetical protein
MKKLLITTAVLESATGLWLLASPALLATLLLGGGLDTPAALTVARVAGVALLAIGVACWLTRHDGASRAARGLVTGLLLYNLGAGALFAQAGLALQPASVGVWGVVVIHTVLAIWCLSCLKHRHV